MQHAIEQDPPSNSFIAAWNTAGRHIQQQADTGFNWLRANLNLPMAEHLSFRIGNQIFFVFINAAEFNHKVNGTAFNRVYKEANAIPCLLDMEESLGSWKVSRAGWGLIHAETGKEINPLDYVSDELIEMTDWELHDFAVSLICADLKKQGIENYSSQPSNHIDPSIWFEDSNGKHFIVVRSGRYPTKELPPPENITDIKQSCLPHSNSGLFASVIFANSDDPFDPDASQNGNFLALYRGHGVMPKKAVTKI